MSLKKTQALAVAALLASVGSLAHASVSYTTAGTAYTEGFDEYPGAQAELAWTNDSTIPGWYLYQSGGTSASAGTVPAVYRYSTTATSSTANFSTIYPTGATYPFYFYRAATAGTNLALGLFNSDSNSKVTTGYISAGVALTNNTGDTLDSLTISYATSAASTTSVLTTPDAVVLSYALDATDVSDASGTWTTITGGGYSSDTTGTAFSSTVSVTLTGISWAPGQTLFIRWRDGNVGGTDRYTKIDNVSITGASSTTVPEPASLSLLGLAGTGLLLRRRR